MNPRTAWTVYTLLRLLFFVVPFAAIMLLLHDWPDLIAGIAAAIAAALISVSLSVLLLSKYREAASRSIHEWRNSERTADDIFEDSEIDSHTPAATDADTRAEQETSADQSARTDEGPTQANA